MKFKLFLACIIIAVGCNKENTTIHNDYNIILKSSWSSGGEYPSFDSLDIDFDGSYDVLFTVSESVSGSSGSYRNIHMYGLNGAQVAIENKIYESFFGLQNSSGTWDTVWTSTPYTESKAVGPLQIIDNNLNYANDVDIAYSSGIGMQGPPIYSGTYHGDLIGSYVYLAINKSNTFGWIKVFVASINELHILTSDYASGNVLAGDHPPHF